MKFQSYFFTVLVVIVHMGCVPDDLPAPKLVCNQPSFVTNKTVQDIHATANAIVTQYKYDDSIEAYVVSSDEGGNFFKSISFQTLATATVPAIGFSVPVDVTNLYLEYRVGNKVFIKLKNLYTDVDFGGVRIGSIFVNSFNQGGVGRLSQNDYKQILNASCVIVKEDALARSGTMTDILKDENLNTLVEFTAVQFAENAIGRHLFEESNNVGGATNWGLNDKLGNQVYVRTSSFANFSKMIVPDKSGKIRGILTKYADDFQLLPRSDKDIVMTAPRAVPFFSQNFDQVPDNATLSLPGWGNFAQAGSLFWRGALSGDNGFAEFRISGTRVNSNIGWLVTPKIDMDLHAKETLTFRAAQDLLDIDSPLNTLEVFVATNFDGLNLASANWTKVTANVPKQATPRNQFIGSGAIDLSAYTGKINIAFKYTGSGRNLALDGTFQVDDIQVFGEK